MGTSKKELNKEIIKKITAIEGNTFLFPKSWADTVTLADYDWQYKTYNNGSVGVNRYHNIEIHQGDKKILDIHFRGDSIEIIQDLSAKQITTKDVYYYIDAIYEELHSFKNHNEGRRKIRKDINKALAEIKVLEKNVIKLKQQLKDSKTKI